MFKILSLLAIAFSTLYITAEAVPGIPGTPAEYPKERALAKRQQDLCPPFYGVCIDYPWACCPLDTLCGLLDASGTVGCFPVYLYETFICDIGYNPCTNVFGICCPTGTTCTVDLLAPLGVDCVMGTSTITAKTGTTVTTTATTVQTVGGTVSVISAPATTKLPVSATSAIKTVSSVQTTTTSAAQTTTATAQSPGTTATAKSSGATLVVQHLGWSAAVALFAAMW